MTLEERKKFIDILYEEYQLFVQICTSKEGALYMIADQASTYPYETEKDYMYVQREIAKFPTR